MRIRKAFVQRRMTVIVVVRISPTTPITIKEVPFGFGESKLGVTPGGGAAAVTVAARKAARSEYVGAFTDDILGTADNGIEMKMKMKR